MKRKFFQLAGWALLAVSLVYLWNTATSHLEDIPGIVWTYGSVIAGAGGISLYVGAIFVWSAGWIILLRAVGEEPIWLVGFVVIGTSQIAKYLPGNVAHHIGRVALAGQYGLGSGRVVLTMAIEMCWLVAASSACALMALALSDAAEVAGISNLSTWHVALLMAAAAVLPFAVLLGLRRWGPQLVGGPAKQGAGEFPDAVTSLLNFLSHFVNFLIQGAILVLLAHGLFDLRLDAYWLATGAFALAWVAGFVAPGVPAGLGVREAILAAGLALDVNAGVAVALATSHRIVTVVGDGVVFAIALLLRRFAIGGRTGIR